MKKLTRVYVLRGPSGKGEKLVFELHAGSWGEATEQARETGKIWALTGIVTLTAPSGEVWRYDLGTEKGWTKDKHPSDVWAERAALPGEAT